jgi:hypothetical protein
VTLHPWPEGAKPPSMNGLAEEVVRNRRPGSWLQSRRRIWIPRLIPVDARIDARSSYDCQIHAVLGEVIGVECAAGIRNADLTVK